LGGSIWCGGELGQIYCIVPDGSSIEQIASSDGFSQGMAFDTEDNLYVACYEPSQVLRISPDGAVARLIGEEEAHLFCHPTNLAFRAARSSRPTSGGGT